MWTLSLALALAWGPWAQAEEGPAASVAQTEEAPDLRTELVREGPLRARLSEEPADLVLLYGSEQEGRLGTCGCPHRPRGGLDRIDRYRRALLGGEAPVLLLNAGGTLDSTPDLTGALRADAVVRNRYLAEGLALGDWDAINVGYRDLLHLARHGPLELAMSANLRPPPGKELATHRLITVGETTVALTGVSEWGLAFQQEEGWTPLDPVKALSELIPTLQADLVVVLAYHPEDPKALAALPGVDVLIEAGGFETVLEPVFEGGALWVRTRHGTQQLGELRLQIEDGVITSATERRIDMDGAISGTGSLRRLARKADREVARVLRQVLEE